MNDLGIYQPESAHASPLDGESMKLVRELQAAVGVDVFREVIALFLAEAPFKVQKIDLALSRADGPVLCAEAHSLKESSGNFGARRLVELCAQLEQEGSTGDISAARRVFSELQEELGRVSAALEADF